MTALSQRRILRDRRGEAALEFALIGVIFLLLLLAPVEAGLMIWTGTALQSVASDTARCNAIGSPTCATVADAQSYAVSQAAKWIGQGEISSNNVAITSTSTCNKASGNFIQVTITASIWSGAMLSPINAPNQTATACFPVTS